MPPEESPQRPAPGRQPHPRRRIAVDGFTGGITPRSNYAQRPIIAPRPTMPVPTPVVAPTPPPVAPVPVEQPLAPPIPVSNVQVAAPAPVAPLIKDFTPQPKQKSARKPGRKLPRLSLPADKTRLKKLVIILGTVVVVVGIFSAFLLYRAGRSTKDQAFNDALLYSLGVKQVQVTTTSETTNSVVAYDLTTPNKPVVSGLTKAQVAGSPVTLAGYGTNSDTFSSYTELPSAVLPSISSVAQNAWIQLRANNIDPVGVPSVLARAGDPHYQLVGPIIFGNFTGKTRDQLHKFLIGQNIYDYHAEPVTKDKIDGKKVIVYTLHINVGALKAANQTAAAGFGMTADQVQQAVDSLDSLQGATVKLALGASNHRPVQLQIEKNDQRATISYDKFNTASLPAQPQTKLTWANFSNVQFQLESQIGAKQPANLQDADRKNQLDALHKALAAYFTQAASYPSLANLNDQSWVKTNLLSLDSDLFRDPVGLNLTLLGAPKQGSYAYQPVPEAGKGLCENTSASPCIHYKLTATLTTKQLYTVQDP